MTLTLLILVIAASATVGLIMRRWLAIVVSMTLIVMFYVGLDSGWWGDGTGDGWQFAMVLAMALGTAISAAAVAMGRAWRR